MPLRRRHRHGCAARIAELRLLCKEKPQVGCGGIESKCPDDLLASGWLSS